MAPPEYTTIANLRDEGVPDPPADARLTKIIQRVSMLIEAYTGRSFRPVTKTIKLDGHDSEILPLEEPIIEVTDVRILYADPFGSGLDDIDLDDIRVYNRHLTQDLLEPDDRESPRLEWIRFDDYDGSLFGDFFERHHFRFGRFPKGTQNIEVTGTFGYTDPDPDGVVSEGITPPLIEHVANLMVIRQLPKLYETDDRDDAGRNRNRVSKYKTRDQEVAFAGPDKLRGESGGGPFTGDGEIDNILAMYSRPPKIGAV